MSNELIEHKSGELVSAISQQGIGEILKPLIREIHLYDTYVAGVTHLKDPSVLEEIRAGDPLTLRREDNRYDRHAILVLTAAGKKLGYIPEKDNLVFARLMDAGKLLKAAITDVRPQDDYFTLIRIGIDLVDL